MQRVCDSQRSFQFTVYGHLSILPITIYVILTVKNPTRCKCIEVLLFLISNEAQHDSDDIPPIIRSLKLHKQPLVLHNTVEGCRTCSCWTLSGSVRYLTTSNNCTSDNLRRYHAKAEAACAVLGA